MPDIKNSCALIADHGLFVELASRLARDFDDVLYFSPWANAYPKAAASVVGRGLEGVTRIDTFWDHLPDADVVIFPDLYFADWQVVVADKFDKPVWGHRWAENLELDRWGTRDLQKALKMPAPETEFLTGTDELEAYLKKTEDKWVKISAYRGDAETFHHENWHTSSIWLDHFKNRVGALAHRYEFMVEENLDGIEVGYDGWTVQGKFPDATFWGFEVKDKGYIGKFSPYEDLPDAIQDINDDMATILKGEKATGFCSFEFRLGEDGKAYMIDPCLRCGSPPFEGTQEGYRNLAEIINDGANGKMAVPVPEGVYLAMAMIHSAFALTNWVPIDCPTDVRRWLKIRNAAKIKGKLYHVPVGGEMPEIGAVCAVADDLDEAIKLVKERSEKIQGFNLEIHVEALDQAQEEIDKAKDYGVEF